MFDVAFLQNNGLMDAQFPYPLAFCTCFNMGVILINILAFLVLIGGCIIIVKWFFKLF